MWVEGHGEWERAGEGPRAAQLKIYSAEEAIRGGSDSQLISRVA